MREWVEVEEQLPEHDTHVLVVDTFWEGAYKAHFALHGGVAHWDARSVEKHYLRDSHRVTHWMPLPAPPAAGG